jgi:hypothetical protein
MRRDGAGAWLSWHGPGGGNIGQPALTISYCPGEDLGPFPHLPLTASQQAAGLAWEALGGSGRTGLGLSLGPCFPSVLLQVSLCPSLSHIEVEPLPLTSPGSNLLSHKWKQKPRRALFARLLDPRPSLCILSCECHMDLRDHDTQARLGKADAG